MGSDTLTPDTAPGTPSPETPAPETPSNGSPPEAPTPPRVATLDDIREMATEEPEYRDYPLKPGLVLRVGPVLDLDVLAAHTETARHIQDGSLGPLVVRGERVSITDQMIAEAALVAAAVVEPQIDARAALGLRASQPLKFLGLVAVVNELCGYGIERRLDETAKALATNPYTPAVSPSP